MHKKYVDVDMWQKKFKKKKRQEKKIEVKILSCQRRWNKHNKVHAV